ncbi:hypothetical protein EJ04DRAFT_490975 [Polyplosphaeria fusca]|uniref:Transcription factor BYE1 n=1 Tax=Polyplosphaeria fusca TaxID=682080 RepID=A0A9P4V406_9PLEO|nr:hypothetical protein EJ04DRAFT_490975 [Polyplosphaeria fusca]
MADEVRRSDRKNRGIHTKNKDLDTPPPKSKAAKGKLEKREKSRDESAQSPEEDEEEDAIIRCVCGDQRDIQGRKMICCDRCEAWQHVRCMGLNEGTDWDNATYFCEQCKPEEHVELLEAMSRGEKPWNRKKKTSKAAKPKSARPSDVKAEPEAEKNTVATPQSAATPPKEAPASAESTNGHAAPEAHKPEETQPPQAAEPKSPVREKRRRDATTEKDNAAQKRRKSSAVQQEKPTLPETPPNDPSGLSSKKQRLYVEKVVDALVPMIKAASESRGYRLPDGDTPISLATRLALQVNHHGVEQLGEPGDNDSRYALHFRSILFNIKKNAVLVDRLLSGSLTPEGLATMGSEDMASEEKQREFAAMREAAEKQSVLVEEPGPRLRKTHKGEEIVGEDNMQVEQEPTRPEPVHRDSVQEDHKPADMSPTKRDGSPSVELPEEIGHRGPLHVDTSGPTPEVRRQSTTFDIQSVFNKVKSPQNNQQAFLPRRQSSMVMQDRPAEGPGDDADVDRLLKDEDNDVTMTDYSADPTIVWQGVVDMQTIGPFDAVARFIAGGDFGQVLPWTQLLSPSLPIQGRIESAKGNDYIKGLSDSESYDVGVLSITPVTHEGREVMDHLFSYFHSKDRWGVVPVDKLGNEAMRDLYIIPVEAGTTNLPSFLDMLEYCTIETTRRDHMILMALVAKLPEIKQQLPGNQQFNSFPPGEVTPGHTLPLNGPSPSPAMNPHGPQFSPLQPSFPPGPTNGSAFPAAHPNNGQIAQAHGGHEIPPHHKIPKAVEIFGPHIDAPVIVNLLTHQPMTELQMNNLMHIVTKVPEARTNIVVLQQHMNQQANGGEGPN